VRFLAGGTLLATALFVGPAWWFGPPWLHLLQAHGRLTVEAWVGAVLALTWLLRGIAALVFLRSSGGRLRASAQS